VVPPRQRAEVALEWGGAERQLVQHDPQRPHVHGRRQHRARLQAALLGGPVVLLVNSQFAVNGS
jgi:hypothetical protein